MIDESADQDSTDLQKCIKCAQELVASRPQDLQGASIFAAGWCTPLPFPGFPLQGAASDGPTRYDSSLNKVDYLLQPLRDVYGTGAFGGRIDHVLSSLCTLHRHEGEKIVLCGDGNLVRLLPCGHTDLEPDLEMEGPACGLVAMAAPATASSQGLKWNLGAPTALACLFKLDVMA